MESFVNHEDYGSMPLKNFTDDTGYEGGLF
jgi:hypothetical protein